LSGNTTRDANKTALAPAGRVLPRSITRRIGLARALLVWERLWAGLWTAAALTGLFVATALLGTFSALPLAVHWGLLGVFSFLLAIALWNGLHGFRWPDRDAALAHLEQASGLAHQPLSAYEDIPAQGSGDPVLWQAHQSWIATRLKKLKLGFVTPGLVTRDPYGLRAIVILLLVIGLVGTGPGRFSRIAAAFFPGAGSARAFTIEAWITPPAYTGTRPVYLERGDSADNDPAFAPVGAKDVIKVPVGSMLSLRAHGLRNIPSLETANDDRGRPEPLTDLGNTNFSADTKITSDAEYALTQGGRLLRGWTIETIPDQLPKIAFAMPLQQTASGSLHFAYTVSDDYGVTQASARVALVDGTPPEDEKRAAARKKIADLFRQTRGTALVTPPSVSLPLKTTHPKDGKGETYVDLTSHPWAGLPVLITLVATDDAGQTGESEPVAMTLPARSFTKPLAAATIEQRRALALAPAATTRVARVLDALTFDGARYIEETSVYLGLRTAYWQLLSANNDEDLNGIYDLLWSVALRIEDGDLSLAEADMRRARDALTKALASGASPDEIAQLVRELKDAFQRYMDALVAKSGNNPDQAMMEKFAPKDGQTIDREALEKMLGEIGELANSGSREDAKRLLEQMQAIMENMQTPDESKGMSPAEKAMAEAVDKISGLIEQERTLMDKTFQSGNQTGDQGGNGGKGNKSSTDLKHEQEGLRSELDAILKALKEAGAEVPGALPKAGDQMKSAEGRLSDGRPDRAAIAQGQAIQNMRDSAQGLVDQLAQSMAGSGSKKQSSPQGASNKDPLQRGGNPSTERDNTVPGQINRQKARAIIEDLRRRASELGRPQSELDYFDRLLNRF
tara:strand:+ start:6292 stop:8850 length:2559 start_codon:yes stop_codon:yes gene_type:complete